MSAAEEIARLTARSAWKTEKLDRSISAVLPSDIAAALPSERLPRLLVMAAYMQDEAAKRWASIYLYVETHKLIQKYGWDVPTGVEIYRAMAAVAVHEAINPMVCRNCEGHKIPIDGTRDICGRVIRGKPVPCPECGGGGIKAMDEAEIYTALRGCQLAGYRNIDTISRKAWERKWRRRYREIYQLAVALHNEGVMAVMENLRC